MLTEDNVKEVKEQIASFFCSCFVAPETFDLANERVDQVLDNEGGGVAGDPNMMLMAMMGG